jgi:hypothetical protein
LRLSGRTPRCSLRQKWSDLRPVRIRSRRSRLSRNERLQR